MGTQRSPKRYIGRKGSGPNRICITGPVLAYDTTGLIEPPMRPKVMLELQIASCPGAFRYQLSRATVANSDETFNWPDWGAILRATYGTNSRDFRGHKPFPSLASSIIRKCSSSPGLRQQP